MNAITFGCVGATFSLLCDAYHRLTTSRPLRNGRSLSFGWGAFWGLSFSWVLVGAWAPQGVGVFPCVPVFRRVLRNNLQWEITFMSYSDQFACCRHAKVSTIFDLKTKFAGARERRQFGIRRHRHYGLRLAHTEI